uniref:Si:dkey-245n4.2 n=1 Tax=Astyanax mexicanus TaxID=7994 RepID=A0A3B1JT05_ASTMX
LRLTATPLLLLLLLLWREEGRASIQDSQDHGTISLEECKPGSALQEWRWSSERQTLRNPKTGKCLTAVQIQEQELIRLRACRPEEEEGQAWSCSRKGHLTLHGKGFHLSAHLDSSSVFLSAERGRSSKWRTLNKQIVCEEEEAEAEGTPEPEKPVPRIIAKIRFWQRKIMFGSLLCRSVLTYLCVLPGLGWKVTMLVLSSLALLLGTVILILNYSPHGCFERAPLTKHPMRPPRSPSIQRGEILVEWKDGTVTPLFDTYLTS